MKYECAAQALTMLMVIIAPQNRGTSFHVREKQIPACYDKQKCKNAGMTRNA
jgi:hypothetical protein